MYIKNNGFVVSRTFICIELVYILYIVHTWHLTLQEKIEEIFMLFHYLIFFQVAKYQVAEINPGLPIAGQKLRNTAAKLQPSELFYVKFV
jgi:hypothetical protein